MQQHKIVEDYLSSVIPEKISEKTKDELREEMESHIYDKADFYIEIGYDEETAIGKAVEQMGEPDSVREKFNALYNDSVLKAVLLLLGICAWNLLSIIVKLGYMNFIDPTLYTLPSVAMLGVFLAVFVCLVVYTIKCIRQKFYKQLMGIISSFILITLGSFVTSGIFFPIINAGKLVFRYITTFPGDGSDLDIYFVNIISLILFTVFSFRAYDKGSVFRKKTYRLSLKQITAILSVSCLCFLTAYGFSFAKYEWWQNSEEFVVETEDNYVSNITAEQRKIYKKIELGNNGIETENELIEKGFVKQKHNYEDFVRSRYFSHVIGDLLERSLGNSDENEYAIYSYTYAMDEDYDDIICCIVVSYNDDHKIDYKLFIPDANHFFYLSYYVDYNHGKETKEWFDSLQKGENCESAFEFIRNTGAHIIEDEKYDGKSIVNTYNIYFGCYHPLKPNFIDFLFDWYDEVCYQYDFEIVAQNDLVSSYTMLDD